MLHESLDLHIGSKESTITVRPVRHSNCKMWLWQCGYAIGAYWQERSMLTSLHAIASWQTECWNEGTQLDS
jgi:hypothetical protein